MFCVGARYSEVELVCEGEAMLILANKPARCAVVLSCTISRHAPSCMRSWPFGPTPHAVRIAGCCDKRSFKVQQTENVRRVAACGSTWTLSLVEGIMGRPCTAVGRSSHHRGCTPKQIRRPPPNHSDNAAFRVGLCVVDSVTVSPWLLHCKYGD
jgi:hypothetical protein